MAYFTRIDDSTFEPTDYVSGAWDPADQHVAPALGLLAHLVEVDRDARRHDGLVLARLSYDIYGTMPVEAVETHVRVVRPGRTIELVEAIMRHDGRDAVSLRAWLLQRYPTPDLAGTPLRAIGPKEEMAPWEPSSVWQGGFLRSLEVRRAWREPGSASYWLRATQPLLDTEPVSPTARAAGLLDLANGMSVRADPSVVTFPNVDLTAHFFDEPTDEWLGFDTAVSFGPDGLGLTASTIHGARGPIGTVAQLLTLRRRVTGTTS